MKALNATKNIPPGVDMRTGRTEKETGEVSQEGGTTPGRIEEVDTMAEGYTDTKETQNPQGTMEMEEAILEEGFVPKNR